MSPALTALECLHALSEAMLGAAQAGDWELLAERENERRQFADQLSATLHASLLPTEHAAARRVMQCCLACDVAVRGLVETRRSELRVVLREPASG